MATANGVPASSVSQTYETIHIHTDRPVYSLPTFNDAYLYSHFKVPLSQKAKDWGRRHFVPSSSCMKSLCLSLFPFIGIFQKYVWRVNLPGDVIAGLTAGVMHIPQGLAYGMLTDLPAVYGLYVSFFPAIIYFFFGTSRHISIGTFAVVCLMIGNVVQRFEEECQQANATVTVLTPANQSTQSPLTNHDASVACLVGVATACTFVIGALQLLLGLLRVGFVTAYLSDPLTRAFVTGSAVHVLTSQLKHVLGLRLQIYSGPFAIIHTYIELFSMIRKTNVAALITSVIVIVFIYSSQRWINPRLKKYSRVPIPNELIVIILGTVISHFAKFSSPDVFNLKVVGTIPTGIPAPRLPAMYRIPSVLLDAVSIAIVAFAVNISMAKLFAKTHGYPINSNQELLAYGLSNIFGSMFNCFTSAASLSRSLVQERVGGVTQLTGLIASSLLLIVLLAIGPLFRDLPNCVLAGIIIINLKGVLLQVTDLKRLHRVAMWDMLIWLATFLSVVFIAVDIGLLIGVVFALFSVVFRTQRPKASLLASIPATELYADNKDYRLITELSGIKIFHFSAPLYYANIEHFLEKLALVGASDTIAQRKVLRRNSRRVSAFGIVDTTRTSGKGSRRTSGAAARVSRANSRTDGSDGQRSDTAQGHSGTGRSSLSHSGEATQIIYPDTESLTFRRESSTDSSPPCKLQALIIDCSEMVYVDAMGLETLRSVMKDYSIAGVRVYLAACKNHVYSLLIRDGAFKSSTHETVFITVHDAVLHARKDIKDKEASIHIETDGLTEEEIVHENEEEQEVEVEDEEEDSIDKLTESTY